MKISDNLKMNKLVAREYPCIHLDTYSYCNAKCRFCGYHNMTRTKGKMSNELLNYILDDVSKWDKPILEISPIHYGEFFLNPDWLYVLKSIETKLPYSRIALPTNGSVLTDDKIQELVKITTLKYLSFSTYAYFDETYEELMGLDPSNLQRIEYMVSRIHSLRPDIMIRIGLTNSPLFITDSEMLIMKYKWGNWAQPHPIVCNKGVNSEYMRHRPYKLPCIDVFQSMMILWDGRVSSCCFDPNAELILGDIKEQSILEIWKGDRVRTLQTLHSEGNRDSIPLCRTCTASSLPPLEILDKGKFFLGFRVESKQPELVRV